MAFSGTQMGNKTTGLLDRWFSYLGLLYRSNWHRFGMWHILIVFILIARYLVSVLYTVTRVERELPFRLTRYVMLSFTMPKGIIATRLLSAEHLRRAGRHCKLICCGG